MQITEDRKKRVIDLYFNQHKTYAEIAEIEKMSPRDINIIIKEEETRLQKYEQQQKQQQISSKAYELFSQGKKPVEVAIALNLREPEASRLYWEYWRLQGLDKLNTIYQETDGKIWPLWKLYKQLIKERRMSIEKVVNAIDIAGNKLPHMEGLYEQVKEQVDNMQRTRQRLVNDIDNLKNKLSILDKTAFYSEQEYKRIKQELQEQIDKKDRIEKLIANILNNDNEGYSKLKHIIKENIKAILSNNKTLLSISLTALIQTLKADAEMVKLIYNMPTTANDREQPKDSNDNNNIAKYLESNKEKILNLAEKNYENLVEGLTNNVMDTAVVSSSNPTLSSPQSSSTFPNLTNQSDTHRKEEPNIYHNNKDDIAV